MPIPCPPISLLLPDDRVILTSREEDGLIISGGDPQTITSVSSLPWQTWDPQLSWTPASAVNHSRYLLVGKFVIFEIAYVFNAGPTFTDPIFHFGPATIDPATRWFVAQTIFGNAAELLISEPAYWMALDVSSGQVAEGQISLLSDSELAFRTGDDVGSSNTFLGSASLTWAAGDKVMATGVVEVL